MRVDRPGGTKGPDAPDAAEPGQVDQASAPFAEALRAGGPVATAAVPEDIEALIGALKTGALTVEGLLQTLVDRAVARAPLSARGQEELRATLRSLLEADPTFRQLTRAIEQG